MSIMFKKLVVKNFMSIGNTPAVFELDSDNTTLVVGENGCGKSQCYTDAITYVLFNKSFRGINKPNLVNSINDTNCLVTIDFSSGNNDYRVRRGMKPGIFEIYKNGELIDQDAKAKDYQTMLEKSILGMNFRSFTQIVILGSASFTPFMQLTASARRDVIEEILEIQVFSTMNGILRTRIAELKDEQTQAKYDLDLIKEKIKLKNAHKKEMIDELNERNEECKRKIEYSQNAIGVHREKIQSINAAIADVSVLTENADFIDSKLKQYNAYRQKITGNINRAETEIDFFDTHSECPTCKQDIDAIFKKTAIEHRTSKLETFTDGLTQLDTELQSIHAEIKKIESVQQDITKLSAQISTENAKMQAEQSYVTKLQTDITSNLSKIQDISSAETNSSDVDSLSTQRDTIEESYRDVANQRHYADIGYRMLKDNGIKKKIIRQYLPMINKLVNEYLSKLSFYVLFVLDEEFKETIKSRHRDNFSYESFSEGEKARINIALLLTWREIARRKNSAACNLLILDEVFSSALDPTGTGNLMELLNTQNGGKNKSNIVIISHTIPDISSDRDKFDKIIEVSKVNNFSQYNEITDDIQE